MTLTRRDFVRSSVAASAVLGFGAPVFAQAGAPYGLKPGKPFAGTTVNIMLPNAGQYRAQAKRLGQLEELTGIKAVHGYVPYGQLLDKITAEAVSGSSAYDLVTYQDTWGPALTPYLDPIDALVRRDGVDMGSYPEVFRLASTFRNTLYGLPVRAQAQLLFHRRDLLEKAGLKPSTTWDELVAVAKAVQDANPGISGIAMDYGKGNGFQNLFTWVNYLRGKGADIVDDGGQVRFNDPAGVEATQMYLDMLLKHKVANPGSVGFVEGDKVNSMAQGNAAMVMVWWWAYSVLTGPRSTLKPEQVGFVNVPSFNNGNASNIGQCMPFAISKLSKNKEAAWEVLKWMANPDLEKDVATDKSNPDTAEIIVVHKASLADEKVNAVNHGLQKAGLASLETARPMPQFRAWPQVASVLENTISLLAANGAPVKPALDEAANEVRRIMRRMG